MSDAKQRKSRPIRLVVTSDKMEKSRVGVANILVKHPRYKKYQRRKTKLMFHDDKNETRIGDEVLVAQTRPLSSRKKFTLIKVVRKFEE